MDDLELFAPLNQADKDALEEQTSYARASTFWQDARDRLKRNKPAMFGLFTLLIIMAVAILGPLISPYTYYETKLSLKNEAPSATFWFGTDELGRDLFTRCWWGARISLFVGLSASLIDLVIGVLFGSTAALLGGKIEEWMMRFADILYTIPYLLVVILLIVIVGSGIFNDHSGVDLHRLDQHGKNCPRPSSANQAARLRQSRICPWLYPAEGVV